MKLGIQLWSVRDEANRNFRETVTELKNMGYEGVEIAGIDSLSYVQAAEILNEVGMAAISAHIALEEIENGEKLDGLKTLGLAYVAFNGLGISAETLTRTKEALTRIGGICRDNKMYLLYHNHDYEFERKDGVIALDSVYSTVSAEYLGAEIDVCWAQYAGVDPAAYIQKYKGRCPVIHLKDYNGGRKGEDFSFRAVGSGVVDMDKVIQAAKTAGTKWLIVEQDDPETGKTPMECAKQSAAFVLNNTFFKRNESRAV